VAGAAETGAQAVASFAGDAAGVLTDGARAFGKTAAQLLSTVENAFDSDGRKRIKEDGPQFRVGHRASGRILRPSGLDGSSSINLVPSAGATHYEETWQLVPSEESGYFYLVSGWDGQNIMVRDSSRDDNAQIVLRKHKRQDKANEKIRVIPIPGQPGWFNLQFKHSGKYVYAAPAAGQIVQHSRADDGARWQFTAAGHKTWDKSGSAAMAAIPSNQVVVHVLENFQGNWLALHDGTNQLGAPFANQVSSIRVPSGYLVTLFDKVDCNAGNLNVQIRSSASSLGGSGLNNDVACVRVERAPPLATGVVRIYLQQSYQGLSMELGVGRHVLTNVFRNNVRSVQVPAGLEAMLYDKDTCSPGSKSLLVTGNRPDLKGTGLDQDIACLVVAKPAPPPPAPATAPAAAPPPMVTVYVDENFQGASHSMGLGQHVLPSSVKNKVSSLRVPAGLKALLVDKDNCSSGKQLLVTGDRASLKGSGLNDDVACVAVSR